MSRDKIKTGQWELAICITVPLVVIIAMLIVGFVYGHRQERLLAQRSSLMNLIPVLEQKIMAAHKTLKPFVVPGVTKDMAADLSLSVSDAALKYGVVIRSSNVEKQASATGGSWIDYKLTLSADGALTSLIAMMDYLGQSHHRFCTVSVSLKTTQLASETLCSADLIMVTRVVEDRDEIAGIGSSDVITTTKAEVIGEALIKASVGVSAWFAEPVTLLSLKNLQNRVLDVPSTSIQSEPDSLVPFRLTGVVRDGKYPVIMTDQGVFGIGAEVGGYKIESIGEDSVSVVAKGGQRETLRLYKSRGGM